MGVPGLPLRGVPLPLDAELWKTGLGAEGGSRTMLICVFCRAFGFHHGVEDEFRFQGGVGVCSRV